MRATGGLRIRRSASYQPTTLRAARICSRMWKQRYCVARIMPSGSQPDNYVRAGNFWRTTATAYRGAMWLCARLSRQDMSRRDVAWHARGWAGHCAPGSRGPAWLGATAAGAARCACLMIEICPCDFGTAAGIRGTSVHPSFEEPTACFRYGLRATKLVRELCALM
jgi:hypothetical protein